MSTPIRTANPNPLVGTWRLISWEVRKADGRTYLPFGQDVDGYIGYTADMHMAVFLRLHGKTSFYAGVYEIDGDRVIHHVMVSNTGRDGFDLVRIMRPEGNRVSLLTIEPPPRSLVDNPEPGDTSKLTWERVP